MFKKVFGVKLNRNTNTRKALFRSLIRSMVFSGKIETTKAKAKAIQSEIDKILGKVSDGSIASRRLVLAQLANDVETTDKLFSEVKKLTAERKSCFTRLVNLPNRKGDNALMARLEWVDTK